MFEIFEIQVARGVRACRRLVAAMVMVAGCLLAGCTKKGGPQFVIQGTVEGIGADTTVVLEAMSLQGVREVGKAKLTASDKGFRFAIDRQICPSFYTLRVGGEALSLCIDSTETVTVTAQLGNMIEGSKIEGSDKCEQLRQISLRQMELLDRLQASTNLVEAQSMVNDYKQMMIADFIAPDPSSAVAYSALLQTINGSYLFDFAGSYADARWLAAIATSWNYLYPNAQRTKELQEAALKSMASSRPKKDIEIDVSQLEETGILDITLPDANGNERRISDNKGKVVLLDFTAYSLPEHSSRTLLLRDLYTKYHDKGLEIFQIGFDPDWHYWATHTDELPWICVYCEEGIYADIVRLYNVQSLPTLFIVDRSCSLHARADQVDDLEAEIRKLL